MNRQLNRRQVCAALPALWAAPSLSVAAPPVTLITPTSPGGSMDALARIVADLLAPITGQPVVVDNKPGANGVIGYGLAARTAPEANVFFVTSTNFAILPSVTSKLPFDVLKDFRAVGGLTISPTILVATSQFPANSAGELKVLMQRDPKKVSFASSDNAALLPTHQLLSAIGANAPIVNYKGSGPAMTDLAGGHVSVAIVTIAGAMPLIKAGRAKPLGLLASKRLKQLPDIPTLIEQGINVEFGNWLGIHASANTPRATIHKLGSELERMVRSPEFESRIDGLYQVPLPLSATEYDAYVASEVKRMASIAAAAGVQPE